MTMQMAAVVVVFEYRKKDRPAMVTVNHLLDTAYLTL
jgi:hypothetical protein